MECVGNSSTYHRDALGSITEVTDQSGALVERYAYDVYGAPQFFDNLGNALTVSAIGNPFLFTGRYYDPESGNYDYRARMYSPALGRFLQTDPLGYVDGLNLYVYVGNNPVSFLDPWGFQAEVIQDWGGQPSPVYVWPYPGMSVLDFQTMPGRGGSCRMAAALHGDHVAPNATYIEEWFETAGGQPACYYRPACNRWEIGANYLCTEFMPMMALGMLGELELNPPRKPVAETCPAEELAQGETQVVEDVVPVYHKGLLNNGVVSRTKTLSTGLDRASVEALQREGPVWEFRIPRTEFLRWKFEGKWESITDYDYATGIMNEEIRFSPRVASQLEQYIVK